MAQSAAAPPAGADGTDTARGDPTKEFFISMLVRDIELTAAIVDLVDNCVDGALRTHHDLNFAGSWVRVTAKPEQFRIADNCGGIPLDVLKDYALCFGRPDGAPSTEHSIGQFGVGMKRALFKLGDWFRIETVGPRVYPDGELTHAVVQVPVKDWRKAKLWDFPITEIRPPRPDEERGTTITVKELHQEVVREFGRSQFIERLRTEIAAKHRWNIQRGIGMSVDEIGVDAPLAELFESATLKPGVATLEMRFPEKKPVIFKAVAGLAASKPREAGWYVYCNGRMILGPDQTSQTVWGTGEIPRYHNQFAYFRGYAFFDSDDAGMLPWRTTKNGVNEDSPVYQRARQEMLALSRPVIDFLNQLKEEVEQKAEAAPLLAVIKGAKPKGVDQLAKAQGFSAPKSTLGPIAPEGRITYWEALDRIRRVKKRLKVTSNEDVGHLTFEYYYESEVDQ
jgi:Histidine kinase-, DNA gyrase B-, and HSP90-like ATPase